MEGQTGRLTSVHSPPGQLIQELHTGTCRPRFRQHFPQAQCSLRSRIPPSPGFPASFRHCLEMPPTLQMVTSDAEESEMTSQLTRTDVLRRAQHRPIFQTVLISHCKKPQEKPISWQNALPYRIPTAPQIKRQSICLGLRAHQHHFGFLRTGNSPDCLDNGKIKTTTSLTKYT